MNIYILQAWIKRKMQQKKYQSQRMPSIQPPAADHGTMGPRLSDQLLDLAQAGGSTAGPQNVHDPGARDQLSQLGCLRMPASCPIRLGRPRLCLHRTKHLVTTWSILLIDVDSF